MDINKFNDCYLIKQGAEAKIYRCNYLGLRLLVKERFNKKYRHGFLDEHLTKERIKSEARAILKCKAFGIKTPAIYLVDLNQRVIVMEYFEHSSTVKDFINEMLVDSEGEKNQLKLKKLAQKVGKMLAIMHDNNIIHGDLTTSNMLLVNKTETEHDFQNIDLLEVVFIDFGLANTDGSAEDKGVDLYVLERAIISTHKKGEIIISNILESYFEYNKKLSKEVFKKYEEVKARGRKRTMVG